MQRIDAEEIGRALDVLANHDQHVEIRGIAPKRFANRLGSDRAALVSAATTIGAVSKHAYLCLNPVEDRAGPSKDVHVAWRRWLFLDIDTRRAGDAATDAEKALAEPNRELIRDWLSSLGWPSPVEVDSGNGFYLLYRIDLPNDDASRELVRRSLQSIAAQFPGAGVDERCFNASRLARLPGTYNRKGEPHRLCQLLRVPNEIGVVSAEMLAALPEPPQREEKPQQPQQPKTTAKANPFAVPLNQSPSEVRLRAYARAAIQAELDAVARAAQGSRNNALNDAVFKAATMFWWDVLDQSSVLADLAYAAKVAGLDESEIQATIQSGLRAGLSSPRPMPEDRKLPSPSSPPSVATTAEGDSPEPVVYPACDVVVRKVEWLWRSRIPKGKLSLLAGVPGVGKTFLLCDVSARTSTGLEWPDEPGKPREAAGVLFISGEDDPDDTLVPRLMESNADLGNVWFLSMRELSRFTLASLAVLDEAADLIGNLALLVIDPPTSYTAGVDDNKNSPLRTLLTPLSLWAKRRKVAVVFNTHLNKGGKGLAAIDRVIGSTAWTAVVRAGSLVTVDPESEGTRFFVPLKLNVGKPTTSLAYTIDDVGDDRGRLRWLGVVDVSADQATGGGNKAKTRRVAAREWLIEKFNERREWSSEELFAEARQCGLTRDAMFEAKDLLKLPRAKRVVGDEGRIAWYWWVPPDWVPPPQESKIRPATEGEV